MRALSLVALALAVLGGCAGKGTTAVKPKAEVGPAIDAKQAEQGASDLVTEIYDTLGRGNKDSLFTLLDNSLIVFGPRRADMLGTRADALVALGQVVDPKAKKKVAIRRGKLELMTSPGGRSAWVFDMANINGHPTAIMAVLSNAADLWLVGAVAVAQTPTAQQAKAELAKDAVVPPGAAGAKKIDPAAKPAIDKFQKGLLDQTVWGDDLASRSDSIVVGPLTGQVARGKKAIKSMWEKRVDAKTRAAIAGEITAAVTDDGQLAWVSAPITRVEDDAAPMPLRAFAVYEKDGADWKLIALHESIALAEPGAGLAFKKFAPAKLPEPKLPDAVAEEKEREKPEKKVDSDKKKPKAEVAKDNEKAKEKPKKAEPKKPEPKKVAKPKPARTADEDEDEAPKKVAKAKPKAKPAPVEDDEDEAPKKVAKAKPKAKPAPTADDDEDTAPRSGPFGKRRKPKADDSDDKPKKVAKAKPKDEEEERPKAKPAKAKPKAAPADDEEEEAAPKPKKKPKPPAEDEDDEDDVEISD